MKEADKWVPTKFVLVAGRLRANPDPARVAVSSRLNVDLLAAALQAQLQSLASGRLLDLGCGSVPLYAVYRDLAEQVTCIDWENSEHQLLHIDQSCDLNGALPFTACSFDTVLMTDVLEHVSRPHSLISEVYRVLAPDGLLLASVPFMYRLHEEPYDFHRYTSHALRRFAASAGFEVVLLEPYGQGTDVVIDSLGKVVMDLHWRWGPRLSGWLQRLGLWLRQTKVGLRLNRGHTNMPLGYVLVLRRPPSAESHRPPLVPV